MSLLEQNSIKKEQVDQKTSQLKFDKGRNNDREYKFKGTREHGFYANELDNHLPGLYYLALKKNYPKKKIPGKQPQPSKTFKNYSIPIIIKTWKSP